ncbi:MAG: T9SS type A sorting domain-containing protein [bacterium]
MKNFLILFSFLLITLSHAFSQDYNIPKKLGISYAGEEFYITFHPTFRSTTGSTDSVKLYLSSEYDTKVTVSMYEYSVNQVLTLHANQITTVSIPFDKVMPYIKPKVTVPDPEKIWARCALTVIADDPIICYAMLEGTEKSEGFLALPKQSLGRSYIVASTRNANTETTTDENTSFTSIVAPYDETKVTITIGGEISNQTPNGKTLNGEIKVTLDKGDVYLLPVVGAKSDLSATKIYASKPVSVISGNSWTHLPEANVKGNYTIEQEIPVESMGTSYNVFPYSYDKHVMMAKIFSTTDTRTDYFKNGQLESFLNKFGGEISFAYNNLEITEYAGAHYTATNPVYITQYEITDGRTSPFQMALLSENQYNESFRFTTPGDYDKTFLSVIYRCPINTFEPMGINLTKKNAPAEASKRLSDFESVEDLLIVANNNGQDVRVRTIEVPAKALYEIKADYPISAYLYGYKSERAFGYPIGTYLNQPQYALDTLAPIFEAGTLTGSKIAGTVRDDDNMETALISGLGEPFLMNTYSANVKFTIDAFSPGALISVKWNLEILDLKKAAKAVIVFTDRTGNQSLYEYSFIPNDNEEPTVTHKINRFGKITAMVTDEPKDDDVVRVGLQSIELGEGSVNYALETSTFTPGLKEYEFTATPIDPKKYGKAVLVIKDKNDNSAGFTAEYNPDNVPPICNWSKPDQFTITGKIIDKPDDDSTRINLDTMYVTVSENVETTIDAYTPNPREIKFTLKQIDHAAAGSVTLYAKDKYDNDSTFSFNFEPVGAVDSDNLNNFVLSPNPAGNYLSISTNGELISKIEIFNNIGLLVAESVYPDKTDVSFLPAGMYYCILHIGTDRVNRQFVILR